MAFSFEEAISIFSEKYRADFSAWRIPNMGNSQITGQYPELLTRAQCAEYLGICLSNLDKSDLPRIKLSTHAVRYRKSDVDAWLDSKREGAE